MPRHPPCALTTQHTKRPNRINCWNKSTEKSRCSRPLSSSHTTPTTTTNQTTSPAGNDDRNRKKPQPTNHTKDQSPKRDSRRCLPRHPTAHRCTTHIHVDDRTMRPASVHPKNAGHHHPTGAEQRPDSVKLKLLRKEVIQPHLPVRLPCYDFVPIADPTFDSSPPQGLGHWLRVLPTFMT